MANKYQSVRGMKDLLPDEAVRFDYVADSFRRMASQAGFGRIETPVLEEAGLYVRGVGTGTDLIDKEIYQFSDRSDNVLALRPEGTAGVARAYIEHGMKSLPQPVKLHYVESIFRYDRPQAGRQRQHTQLGAEILGEAAPSADAQIITLASRLYTKLGLAGTTLQINSIGDENCRPKYRKLLLEYLSSHKSKLCETCQARLELNPLRVLDCKVETCQPVIQNAPQTLNNLCKACHAHFTGVLEYLDDLEIRYELNPQIVRGLDYYTRTVFEFYGRRAGSQASIGSGGRYDGLVENLGGPATPGVGIGIGVERILLEMAEEQLEVPARGDVRVYVASLGEPARLAAFRLTEKLLDAGVGAVGAVDKNAIGAQLSKASKIGAPYAVIIGQKEVFDGSVILRDMETGVQENVPLDKIVAELQKRFK